MIDNFVKFELQYNNLGTSNALIKRKHIVLKYPCSNTSKCTPYKITLSPGTYKIECWGSKGLKQREHGKAGLGAYTRGSFAVFKKTVLYGYVGASGSFNSIGIVGEFLRGYLGGGATDIRLEASELWNNTVSLKSRIMVAAGGGGAEWGYAIGGNGGELEGWESTSSNDKEQYGEKCKGASQTSGSECPKYGIFGRSYPGLFGTAKVFESNDHGGLGGGGYYAGTSYDYSYAGSGGSSFISGHKGCIAVKQTEGDTIEHADNSFHYSGYFFHDTEMIGGNKTMPLPSGGRAIWNEDHGAIRISLLSFNMKTMRCMRNNFLFTIIFVMILNVC